MKNNDWISYDLTLKITKRWQCEDHGSISRTGAWRSTIEFRVPEIHATSMISKDVRSANEKAAILSINRDGTTE